MGAKKTLISQNPETNQGVIENLSAARRLLDTIERLVDGADAPGQTLDNFGLAQGPEPPVNRDLLATMMLLHATLERLDTAARAAGCTGGAALKALNLSLMIRLTATWCQD